MKKNPFSLSYMEEYVYEKIWSELSKGDKGLIISQEYGHLEFALPRFKEFVLCR